MSFKFYRDPEPTINYVNVGEMTGTCKHEELIVYLDEQIEEHLKNTPKTVSHTLPAETYVTLENTEDV